MGGVLRSMGWNRHQIAKVMIYELVASTLAAMVLGFSAGIIVSLLNMAQFHIIVELPMQAELPWMTIVVVLLFSVLSLIIGGRYGTSILFQRNIASILKG